MVRYLLPLILLLTGCGAHVPVIKVPDSLKADFAPTATPVFVSPRNPRAVVALTPEGVVQLKTFSVETYNWGAQCHAFVGELSR